MNLMKRFGVVLAAVVVVFSGLYSARPAITHAAEACGTVSAKLVPACGAWFGGYTGYKEADIRAREAQINRKYDIVHYYKDWDGEFLTGGELALANEGRTLFYNFENRYFEQGGGVCWSDIANGSQDTVIDAKASVVAAFNKPLFVTFMHEPEDNLGACDPANGKYGTTADYAAAYRRMHERFDAVGAMQAVWVWNMMGTSSSYADYPTLWPGDAYVDWVAADRYNWSCRDGIAAWRDFAAATKSFYDWMSANSALGQDFAGKPYMLAEYGTAEDPSNPTRKGDWFRNMAAQAQSMPRLKAVVAFDRPDNGGTTCNFQVGTSANALAGHTAAGSSPYFKQLTNDTIKPPAPTNLKVTQIGKRKTTLTWNASADVSGIKHYRITRDGGWNIGTATGTTYTNTTLPSDGWHAYIIYAVDNAGNESVASAEVPIKLVP